MSLIDDHRHIGGPVGLHIAYYVAGCKKACARPVNGRHTKRCRPAGMQLIAHRVDGRNRDA
ncbi:hypothetical protein VDR47_21545, partial [Xanthomonas campestris pv. campestris]|nr:hypothetical protein [Xanthomonas campestris pv. campestris]